MELHSQRLHEKNKTKFDKVGYLRSAKTSLSSHGVQEKRELLKANVPVAQIFDMGEWKGAKSVVRYADEDAIDPLKLMEAAIELSEEKKWSSKIGGVNKRTEDEKKDVEAKATNNEVTARGSSQW